MYISPFGRSLALSQSFGKTRLANNIYEMNTAEDRASVQGLYDISKKSWHQRRLHADYAAIFGIIFFIKG